MMLPAIEHDKDCRVGCAAEEGGLLCVIPVLAAFTADVCIPSIMRPGNSSGLRPEHVLIVDNSKDGFADKYGLRTYRDPDSHNLGVARAWNVGAKEVLERDLDYLLVMSASMEFGVALHTTWVEQMERFWGENVIEATGHSWHLIAFHRRVFERVGLFDGNFYPAYEEAIDFGLRMDRVGWGGGWSHAWVNAMSQGFAQHHPLLTAWAAPLQAYYAEKWGGKKGEERWDLPFGDKPLDYWEDVPIPELARRYKLGEQGVGWW